MLKDKLHAQCLKSMKKAALGPLFLWTNEE